MRIIMAGLAIALMTTPATAQMAGMGGHGGRGHHGHAQKSSPPKKKADDTNYKAAIESLPDKKIDPWADRH
jgi:hypothetical protein